MTLTQRIRIQFLLWQARRAFRRARRRFDSLPFADPAIREAMDLQFRICEKNLKRGFVVFNDEQS
jgi:hypothetical protein